MGLFDWLCRTFLVKSFTAAMESVARQQQIDTWRRKRQSARSHCILPDNGVLPPRKTRDPRTGQISETAYDDGLHGLAKALGLRPNRFARLLFSEKRLYTTFRRPKADGGERTIDAPVPPLKFVQRRIVDRILNWIEMSDCVHGFRQGRSLVTGAAEHVGQEMVLRMDIADFFPSIHFGRVHGLFRSLQFAPKHAFMLAKLTTVDGVLPQGAPSSPGIANAICRKLDRRILGAAAKRGVVYTRYADDLTFSGPADAVKSMIPFVRKVIAEEGFAVSQKKVRLMRRGSRQIVTGVVVNDRLSVPRSYRRWLRAVIHTLGKKGVTADGQTLQEVWASLKSHAHFVAMVNPEQGEKLLDALASAARGHVPTADESG